MKLRDRGWRVRQLREEGRRIFGYFCCYVPLEFLTALEIVPYRIWGNMEEPIEKANLHFISTSCHYVRSCFDNALKGYFDFFDGVVGAKTCDTADRLFQVWKYVLKPPYSHVIHIPNAAHPSSYEFFKAELELFKESLETFTGRRITTDRLRKAIKEHNTNRNLVKELYELRKEKPPVISGSEFHEILIQALSLPVEEASRMLRNKREEFLNRHKEDIRKPRILLWGTPVDDVSFLQLIEECGADVVMDDTCVGSRHWWPEVSETDDDPMTALADRYTDGLRCPFRFPDIIAGHKQDVEKRYGYLKEYIEEFKVDGVIMQVVGYCAIHALDVPDVKDYLNELGVPVLVLEHNYSTSTFAPLRTRIQAFIETLE